MCVRQSVYGGPSRGRAAFQIKLHWNISALARLSAIDVRLLEWTFCLCLYTSNRMRGRESRARMQAAMAKATGMVPGGLQEKK